MRRTCSRHAGRTRAWRMLRSRPCRCLGPTDVHRSQARKDDGTDCKKMLRGTIRLGGLEKRLDRLSAALQNTNDFQSRKGTCSCPRARCRPVLGISSGRSFPHESAKLPYGKLGPHLAPEGLRLMPNWPTSTKPANDLEDRRRDLLGGQQCSDHMSQSMSSSSSSALLTATPPG